MKISYCITCFNRFEQLQNTLLKNLKTINNVDDVNIILVNFNGNDNELITNYINENCIDYILNKKLIYYIRLTKFNKWSASIAKNVSHLLSNHDLIVNLDCDNFIPINNHITIRNIFNEDINSILHQSRYNKNTICFIKQYIPDFKTYEISDENDEVGDAGRIIISKNNFLDIGGYDENLGFMGFEDTDIIIRLIKNGLKYRHIYDGQNITNIPNPSDTETNEYKENWWKYFIENQQKSFLNIKSNILKANKNGFSEKLDDYILFTQSINSQPIKLNKYYIHFIFFGFTEFEFVHYIAVLSAKKHNPNAIINMFYYKESNNEYWIKIKEFCNMIYTIPPNYANNKTIDHYQYKADFLRLEILYEYGGVYLDIDVITLKSFESLIDYDCCLSGEKYINDHIKFSSNINDFSSITNAIIICKKKNKFIKKWLEMTESEYMSNDIWAWHAVLLPLEILKNNNYNIHIEPVESFIPFNFRCHDILSDNKPIDLNKSYCFHLWETIWNDYLKSYTENSNNNTNLGNIISDILTIK